MKDLINKLCRNVAWVPGKNYATQLEEIMDEGAAAIEKLKAERERLTGCLRRANSNHEEFERKWYLATDENAQLKAEIAAMREQKPCATIAFCSLNGAEDCTCGVNGPCEQQIDVYTAPGAK